MIWNLGEIEIIIKYKDYEAVYYKDNFYGELFYNLEIYKDNKCLRHSTLDKEPTADYVCNYLKSFVDKC